MGIALGVGWIACAGLGCFASAQKGRPAVEGLLLGLFFGPLGAIAALLLPTIVTLYPRLRAEEGDELVFDCPTCGREARLARDDADALLTCPRCRSRLRVPATELVVAPRAEASRTAADRSTFVPAPAVLPLPATRFLQGELIVWVCRCGEERMARRSPPGATDPCRKCGAVFQIPG